MAKVTVAGEVAAVSETKTGKPVISMWEQFQDSQDMQRNRRWTLWVPMTGFESIFKGDWIEIEGDLSTKVGSWTDKDGNEKQTIDHNINFVKLIQHKPIVTPEAERTMDDDDLRKYGNAPF
jgi:hypothetical protein